MDVLELLDKLDTYLTDCARLPVVGKLMVDEDEVFNLIDDLRAALPQEIEQARWLLRERERILQEAKKEAEEIVKDAQGQIAVLASDSVIAKEARAQADELMEKAGEVAREINLGARKYADEIMRKVQEYLTNALQEISQGREELAVTAETKDGENHTEKEGFVFDQGNGLVEEAQDGFSVYEEETIEEFQRKRWGR